MVQNDNNISSLHSDVLPKLFGFESRWGLNVSTSTCKWIQPQND